MCCGMRGEAVSGRTCSGCWQRAGVCRMRVKKGWPYQGGGRGGVPIWDRGLRGRRKEMGACGAPERLSREGG
jgi:hypothetical protein